MNESQVDLDPNRARASWSRKDIAFFLFVSVFIFLQVFILPFTPVYVEGDQLASVSNAMRLLDGEVMYRDFFYFLPPGAELYYAALFYLFGVKIWILNFTVLVLGVAQLYFVITFSKRLFSGPYVYLPALLYFVVGFRVFGIDGSSRLFSVIFVLAAVMVVGNHRTSKALAAAGALCGIASFFVQTRGLLGAGAIGLFLLWLRWKQGIELKALLKDWLTVGSVFIVVVIITQFYMAYAAGFDNYYFANVTFVKDYYRNDTLSNFNAYLSDLPNLNAYIQNYGNGPGWFRFVRLAGPILFFYIVVPLTYVVYLIYRKRRAVNTFQDEWLILLSFLGIVLYLGVSAPTGLRLAHISIPAVVVLVWLLSRVISGTTFAKVALCGLSALGVLYSIQRQAVANVTLELPGGKAAFLAANAAEKYAWLVAETKPGEAIFEAQHPTFYFPLHLKNPTPFYLVRDSNYTPTFQIAQLMRALENSRPRFIIWHGGWSKEASEREPGDNLAPVWDFIRMNYGLKKEFHEVGEFTKNSDRDIEIWERLN